MAYVSLSSTLIDKIMMTNPRATIMSSTKDSHPHTMAPAPMPPLAAPYVNAAAIAEAAAPAMCCQKLASRATMADAVVQPRATLETGRDGNGLTSIALPSEFSSSCQPGKVARRSMAMMESAMEMKLEGDHISYPV